MEENNEIPQQPSGITRLDKFILTAIAIIFLLIIWAYFTGRLKF